MSNPLMDALATLKRQLVEETMAVVFAEGQGLVMEALTAKRNVARLKDQITATTVVAEIKRAKADIRRDIATGKVPASAQSFEEMHDYVDANMYILGDESWMEHDERTGDWSRATEMIADAVQVALVQWILAGGHRQ